MAKQLQHYVPRFYLKAWLDADGAIFCLQKHSGKVFGTKDLMKVGGENNFYRLRDLTVSDMLAIEKIAIDPSPDHLKKFHYELTNSFDLIMSLKKLLQSPEHDEPAARKEVEKQSVEFGESINTSIERGLQGPLASMLAGDIAFIEDDDQAAGFFYALSHQCMRTRTVKEALMKRDLRPPFDQQFVDRTWNVLSHIFAVNVGWSFFAERKLSKIALLDNPSDTPFITADQPVINLRSSEEDGGTPPEKIDLFFPLSPVKAMILLEPNSDYPASDGSISADQAHAYNLRIAKSAHAQIYSHSEDYLDTIKSALGS
jgi:hypothetical protein